MNVKGLILFCLVIISACTSELCDPGWILDRSSCYYIGLDDLTWDSANLYCQSLEGYLVEVNDATENSLLKEKAVEHKRSMWIGLTDIHESNTWIWTHSGNKITECSLKDWAPNEPNNAGPEDCVHYFEHASFAWNDEDCTNQLGYICEKEVNGASVDQIFTSHHVSETDCTCQSGYTGDYCELDIDECENYPCHNGATCQDHVNNYSCACPEGFSGNNCETDLCRPNAADVVFLLDASLSLSETIFQTTKRYVKDFVTNFPIGPSDFQFALVTFSFNATIHFPLNKHVDNATIMEAIDSINFDNGPTFTGKGLKKIREEVFTSTNGARDSVKKYVIVLTDGLSSDLLDTKTQADVLKTDGVDIVSIGAGKDINHQELIDIASHRTRVCSLSNKDSVNMVVNDNVASQCPGCYHSTSDVAIMIDSSKDGFPSRQFQQISAITYLIKDMSIGEDGAHVSCAQFAETVNEVFKFTDYMKSSDILVRLNKLKPMSSSANVIGALKHLRQFSFLNMNGVRSETRKIALLVTNGNFNGDSYQDILEEAKLLKESGVLLATITIGIPESMDLLLEMASDPMFTYIIGDDIDIKRDVLHSLLGSIEFDVCSRT